MLAADLFVFSDVRSQAGRNFTSLEGPEHPTPVLNGGGGALGHRAHG